MPAFRFRFETLLAHRRREEERCQRALATQLRKQMVMRGQLSGLQSDIDHARARLGDALVGAVDLTAVGGFTRFSAQTTVRGRQLVERLGQLEHLIGAARRTLMDAVRQRKALETLRERDHHAWTLDRRRVEQAQLDEQAALAWARQSAQTAAHQSARSATEASA